MKKLVSLTFVLALGLALVGCGSSDSTATDAATPASKIKDKTPDAEAD